MRLFGKQFLISTGIMAISLMILGLTLSHTMGAYLIDQQKAAVADSAMRVAHQVEPLFMQGYIDGDMNLDQLAQQIENLIYLLDASVDIINADFSLLFSCIRGRICMPESYLEPVMDGTSIVLTGSFNSACPGSSMVAGHPIMINNRIIGAVVICISMEELESVLGVMRDITILSLPIAILAGFILILFYTRAITRPLKQMNDAAAVIASGVFEKRIQVRTKDEVGQLATQFNTMAESLHRQDKIRRDFVANLSHDIRSPLTSMLGFIKAIQDGTIPPPKQAYYLGIVLGETERLINLSNNLLDLHCIQDTATELKKTTFDINELVRKTIMGLMPHAIQKQITVTSHFAHVTDMVLADMDKIQRCIHNLFDNAIKFTPQAGSITVETTIKARKVVVSITDTGRGMTDEEKRHAFDRFYKGDRSRSEYSKGSGLGLSIAQEFIHAHGELITFDSQLNKGSTFRFTLARAEEARL